MRNLTNRDINTLKKRRDALPSQIEQAKEAVASLVHLKDSENPKERLKYLSAELDVAMLKNDLANINALITLGTNRVKNIENASESSSGEKEL